MSSLKNNSKFKRGGISMFLVVIVGSLVALMVASFMRLVVRDQSQASNLDLSQSAYDSAQVGVEDAKKFMDLYSSNCANGFDVSTPECVQMRDSLNSTQCNAIVNFGKANPQEEVKVQTSSTTTGDADLSQAYTCLKVTKNTDDFLGKVSPGASKIVPLRGVSDDVRRIRLSWHSKEDMTTDGDISLERVVGSDTALVDAAAWNSELNRPAVIKAQFFGYNASIQTLDQLDGNFSTDGNGLDEQIYYPASSSTIAASNRSALSTTRRQDGDSSGTLKRLSMVKCAQNLNSATYACSVTVDLGHNVQRSDAAFVRLTPIYKAANFKVELLNASDQVVQFDGVQPKVDSTGRANDQFRRVESRIEFDDQNFPVPDFAMQLEDGSSALCKNFWVTNLENNIPEAEANCKK